MSNRFANPKTMPAPRGYTQVVETTGPGRTVYLSGQLGMTPGGAFAGAPGDFRAQATQCFENLKAGLKSVGGGLRARGEDHQFLRRHGAPAGVLRGARRLREHQGAAGLDRDPGRPAGARRRAVRGRGGGGDPGQGREARRERKQRQCEESGAKKSAVSDAFTRITHNRRMPSFVYVLGCRTTDRYLTYVGWTTDVERRLPSTIPAPARARRAGGPGCCCTPRGCARAGRR